MKDSRWSLDEQDALESLREYRGIISRLLDEAVKESERTLVTTPLEGDGSAVLNAKARLEGAQEMAIKVKRFLLK